MDEGPRKEGTDGMTRIRCGNRHEARVPAPLFENGARPIIRCSECGDEMHPE